MSWTSPPTYTTGQLMTAAIANAQWRDNLNLIVTSIETASGKLAGSLKRFDEDVVSVAFSATPTFDLSQGNNFVLGALTGNVTGITVSNWTASKFQTAAIKLTQDATGGRTVTFPAGWKWSGGTAPTMPTGASKTMIILLTTFDGGTTIFASVVVLNA